MCRNLPRLPCTLVKPGAFPHRPWLAMHKLICASQSDEKKHLSWATKCANNAQPHSYTHLILFDNMQCSIRNILGEQFTRRRTINHEGLVKLRHWQFKGTKAKLQRKGASPLLEFVKTCSRFSDLGQAIKCLSGTTYILLYTVIQLIRSLVPIDPDLVSCM